jgi:hypothetical protein
MEGLDKSLPLSEGMIDAEQGSKATREPLSETCLNCGTKLLDTYCHHCGQKNIPRRQTLGELLTNFISSFWSYEGKFFLTTKYLITRPGFLAVEYTEGKRERYYHPARMYVFISFVFFLIAFSLPGTDDTVELTEEDRKELSDDLKNIGIDTLQNVNDSTLKSAITKGIQDSVKSKKKKNKNNFSLNEAEYKSVAAYDSAQQLLPEEERDNWFIRKLEIRAIELNEKYKDGNSFSTEFGNAFKDNFSKVLFYLLPFFALVLRLLYIRRDFFYSEHLVFSIYYYNFFYLSGSIFLVMGAIPVLEDFTWVVGFWIYFYLLFAMKRMYLQSWKKTILKFGLFSFLFLILMAIALSISALAILMVM